MGPGRSALWQEDSAAKVREGGSKLELFGLQLVFCGLCILGLLVYGTLSGTLVWAWLWRWGLLSLLSVFLVTVDLAGMTPVLKSGTHKERGFRIAIDTDRCAGEGTCIAVCPRGCFALDAVQRKVNIASGWRCVQCGACVVQCPCDALSFVGPAGETLPPETIRTYKLNLMGKRAEPGD
jgi:NAD-dependent dihydropyrimidine dehydrogenase PreA subunit